MIRWAWLLLPLVSACGGGAEPQTLPVPPALAPLTAQQTVVDPDVNGPAGQTYRLYRAAFARTPDLEGLGFHIAAMQAGHSIENISGNFLASPEFQERYGALDNVAFVTQLYANVLGREPDAQGLAFHVGNLDSGILLRQHVLIGFSESPENKENTAAETAGGIAYIPYTPPNPETSYANYKSIGLGPMNMPYPFVDSPRTFGNFTGQGGPDLFLARLQYRADRPIEEAQPAIFEFWQRTANGFQLRADLITGGQGCIHPRKAMVADFNRDGRPDVFVACHGYDTDPFPGERNKVVLSQPGGAYAISDASIDVGFFHGGSAADINRDGHVDVLLVNGFEPSGGAVLLNQGNGSFVRDTIQRMPAHLAFKPYFSAELVDVNEDGLLDLVAGGHEWEGGASTAVFLNPGSNNFSQVPPIALPAVPAEGVVLDFTLTGSGDTRTIWVVRTSGGDGTFYNSRVVQRVRWPSLQSDVVLNQRPKQWVPWLIPAVVNGRNVLTTDNAADGVSIAY